MINLTRKILGLKKSKFLYSGTSQNLIDTQKYIKVLYDKDTVGSIPHIK